MNSTSPAPAWAPPAPTNAGVPAQVPVPQAVQPVAVQPQPVAQPVAQQTVQYQPAPVQQQPVAQQPTPVRQEAVQQPAAVQGSAAASTVAAQPPLLTLLNGTLAGAVAGLVSMGLLMYAATAMNRAAEYPLLLLASIGQGPTALVDGSAILGAIAHVGFGILFGIILAFVQQRLRLSPSNTLLAALVFSVGIFAVDSLLGPVLRQVLEVRTAPVELLARLVFGAVLALGLMKIAERNA